MRIGELAARLGLNPKSIRYYEEIGLLPPAPRTGSGYRLYAERDVARLGFIRRAKLLGLSLDEIRNLLAQSECGEQPCGRVLALLDAKLAEVARRIRELEVFQSELARLRADWADRAAAQVEGVATVCPIIETQTGVTEHPNLARELGPLGRHHPGNAR